MEEKGASGKSSKKLLKVVVGGKLESAEVIKEELQQEKLRTRARRRTWEFEKKLVEVRGSELAKCWKEMKGRIKKGAKLSGGKRKKRIFWGKG